MGLYTCVHQPLADVIMENAPEYKQFNVYAYSESLPGYVWIGKVHHIYDQYPLEYVDMIDEEEGAIYLLDFIDEPEEAGM